MGTMMEKYASQLELIKNEPDYNRIPAIKRFFQLLDFENTFLLLQQEQLGNKISRTKAITTYCTLRNIPVRSLYRWIVKYREQGIKGLLPKFGKKSKHVQHCEGGSALHRRESGRVMATIAIDISDPLRCLKTIQKIIERSKQINPRIKAASLLLLKHYFTGYRCKGQLSLNTPLSDDESHILRHYKAGIHKNHSKKASVILMANDGCSLLDTMESTHAAERTIYHWLHNFNKDRLESIKIHIHAPAKEKEKAERQTRVIDIVHKMPSLYGINRTTWTYGAIAEAYQKEYGSPISIGKIQGVIHNTDYSWRRARRVLTSPDPEYREKVEKLLDTLQGLKEGERFFFIDEVGPYRVKKYGGRILMPKNQTPELPEYQKSRGKIQFVAALEAVTNQMSWLFTPDKTAVSMIALFEKIVLNYTNCPVAYFTWDAISVHSAKSIVEWISAHNKTGKSPHIDVVPLPSKSQFLNVIEAVFGGMKKAVICNSDYATPHDMQEAIARHFEERNTFYRENPKKAGNKLWDRQKFDFDKLAGGLFKKM